MRQITQKALGLLHVREKRRYALLTACHVAISITDIAALILLVGLIGYYTQGTPGYLRRFMPGMAWARHPVLLFLGVLCLFALKNYAGFVANKEQCRFMAGVASRISRERLGDYLHGDYAGFVAVDSAVRIREISYNPIAFSQHILTGIQQVVSQAVIVTLAIGAILVFNPRLFLLLFLILLPPVVIVFYRLKKRSADASARAKEGSERSLKLLQEALEGFIESNLYQRSSFFVERYSLQQRMFNGAVSDYLAWQEVPPRVIETVALAGLFLLVAVAGEHAVQDQGMVLTIGAFMAAAYKIIPGVVKILNVAGQIHAYSYTLEAGEAVSQPRPPGAAPVRQVVFEEVGFGYRGKPLLSGLNLRLDPGDFMGITGPSGRGKTTILHLLLGFLEPEYGRIAINGAETTTDQRRGYRDHISYVRQQPFLIQGSIADNVLLGAPTRDRKRLDFALEASGLTDVFRTYGWGPGKIIAERGRNISGGQRQRIAFARALYKQADLLILDEPFSELDEPSAQQLLGCLKGQCAEDRIVLLINHHAEGMSFCNKTLHLHAG